MIKNRRDDLEALAQACRETPCRAQLERDMAELRRELGVARRLDEVQQRLEHLEAAPRGLRIAG
jgi:hypothetical protein